MEDRLMPRECVCEWIGTDECIECYRDKHPIKAEYGWFWDESQGKYTYAKLENGNAETRIPH